MHIELLRQFGQRLVALQGSGRYLGLEFRRVIPPLPSRHALAPFLGRYAACGWARLSLIHLYEFPGPALRFVIERIAACRIRELDDLLPWNVAAQIAKTTELTAAA